MLFIGVYGKQINVIIRIREKTLLKRHSHIFNISTNPLESNVSHVIAKNRVLDKDRLTRLIKKVESFSDEEVDVCLAQVTELFSGRHRNYEDILDRNYKLAEKSVTIPDSFSKDKKLVLGAYCTNEYSIESAALFNPSIVPHPDQSQVNDGDLRFIMSLRATGEGHISSIVFRTGIIDKSGETIFDDNNSLFEAPKISDNTVLNKDLFVRQILDNGVSEEVISTIFNNFDEEFTKKAILDKIANLQVHDLFRASHDNNALEKIKDLLEANYDIEFSPESDISERVIFPNSSDEAGGIEDARFVRFTEDDGSIKYYATYTAYSNPNIQPKLIETDDFLTFKVRTLSGNAAKDKGFALFPKKVNGQYAMLSRQDGVHNYIMFSDDLHRWDKAELLETPEPNWALTQQGNCGSPIETPNGWLMIMHGVGMMREYSIGAILLDLEDPSKVIGAIKDPLIAPEEREREGYVPNVVYSCGALIHNEILTLPYAASDQFCLIATTKYSELLKLLNVTYKTDNYTSSTLSKIEKSSKYEPSGVFPSN